MAAPTNAELLAAKAAAERIVAAFRGWQNGEPGRRDMAKWNAYCELAITHGAMLAETVLAMPEVEAAHWQPVLAGGAS